MPLHWALSVPERWMGVTLHTCGCLPMQSSHLPHSIKGGRLWDICYANIVSLLTCLSVLSLNKGPRKG